MKKVMAGIDLHSNNVVVGIMDTEGERVASAKLPCEIKEIVKFLAPFKKRLERVAVESTYNWYWLVDGLQALQYPVVLANLYIFALIGLVVNLISDLTYTWIDPRIDFETREV